MKNWVRMFLSSGFAMVIYGVACASLAQEYRHDHIQTVSDEQLSSIIHIEATEDGKKVYTVGFAPGYLLCFDCDLQTGKLTKAHSLLKSQIVSLDISDDQQWIATCCSVGKVSLYRRDQQTGAVDLAHEVMYPQMDQAQQTFSAKFSPDAKYIYVACRSDRVLVLRVDDDKMILHQQQNGAGNCLDKCQIVTRNPAGTLVFVSSSDASTISVFKPEEDGRLRLLSYTKDNSLHAALLEGVHGIDVSADGKHLYVTSGRFGGDNAVSGFLINVDGSLKKVCEMENGIEIEGFEAGHFVKVSPDGRFVYASGTKSKNLACFRRDMETGKLQFQEYLSIGGNSEIGRTAGIGFSAGGEYVYVAIESRSRIEAFRRTRVSK